MVAASIQTILVHLEMPQDLAKKDRGVSPLRRTNSFRVRKKLMLFIAVCAMIVRVQAQPMLILSQEAWDFGHQAARNGEIEKNIVVRNIGNETLRIASFQVTCGCVTGRIAKNHIKPGEQTSIELRLSLNSAVGRVAKYCIFTSNDDLLPTVRIPISGCIEPAWTLMPKVIQLGAIPGGREVQRTVNVAVRANSKVRIVRATSSCPFVSVKIDSIAVSSDTPATIEVSVATSAPPGPFVATIEVVTEDEVTPRQTFDVIGVIDGWASISVLGQLRFGSIRRGTTMRREFVLRRSAGSSIIPTELHAESRDLSTAIRRSAEDEESWFVEVTLAAGQAPGYFVSQIAVKSSDSEQPEFRVPVNWTVQ